MEFGFLFPNNTNFSVPPVKITSDMQLKWLIELNKRHHTPLCVTLIRREQPMNRPNAANEADDEVRDELYHNRDDFWNTVEIARDDDVVFPETNATQRPPEIVQDNEEEFPFTNDDLIASVSRSNQAGPSSRSSQIYIEIAKLKNQNISNFNFYEIYGLR
ncbi:uncharacterized protein Fot_31036 [Forsythia ovata]|uniref:Uncharacterized protein n=1 Tax=Forsythia ovata TaxID=205694 RepID=A0ABD1T3T2_9LAMI